MTRNIDLMITTIFGRTGFKMTRNIDRTVVNIFIRGGKMITPILMRSSQ